MNIESVFSAPIIIARRQRIDNLADSIALECQIVAYPMLELKKRTPEAIIDDPYAIRAEGPSGPNSVDVAILKKCAREVAKSPMYRQLFELVDADSYGKCLGGLFDVMI